MALFDFFNRHREKDLNLGRLAAAKALDIPMDNDMNIVTTKGISTTALLGALGLTGGLAVAIPLILNAMNKPTPTPPIVPSVTKPIDSEYEVRFYNSEGELIKIPQKP